MTVDQNVADESAKWVEALWRHPGVRRGRWMIGFVVVLAVFGDFLANKRPLVCKMDGEIHSPVCRGIAVDLGLVKWPPGFAFEDWKTYDYDWVIYAPIAWSAGSIDAKNMNAVGPFDQQRLDSHRFRHWLGTDQYGRDVAAGLISGARVSLAVGLLAMLIAGVIGLALGATAGYFGDSGLKVSAGGVLVVAAGLFMGVYGSVHLANFSAEEYGGAAVKWLAVFGYCASWIIGGKFVAWLMSKTRIGKHRIKLPADQLVMRLIEVVQSIPVLLLILSLLAVVSGSSLLYIALIIGLVRWTTVARFVRAELLRIRQLDYIDSARSSGLSQLRILFVHALPNAMTPVIITLAFGVASAILAEASLSFLGIGVPEDTVTWGGLLHAARADVSAWWLAVFPGTFIFLTVTGFNLIGEGLRRKMDGS